MSWNVITRSCTALLMVAIWGGCAEFSDTQHVNGLTKITYDNRLPNALEGVFEECAEPLTFEAGMDELDLLSGCSIGDLDNDAEIALAVALAFETPMELDPPISSHIRSEVTIYDDFPWPVQNCELIVVKHIYFDSLTLIDLYSYWTTHNGDPSLYVDFDFTNTKVAEVDIDVTVDCPRQAAEDILNNATSDLRAELIGTHDIHSSGRDLDIYVSFTENGGALDSDIDVIFTANNLWIDLDWSQVETVTVWGTEYEAVDREETENDAKALFVESVDDMFTDALADLPDQVVTLMEAEFETGHQVCEVELDGGELVIRTDSPGPTSCTMITTPPGPHLELP